MLKVTQQQVAEPGFKPRLSGSSIPAEKEGLEAMGVKLKRTFKGKVLMFN